MSESLNKESILKSDDLRREKVEIPEWGGHVWVRALSGKERDKYETSVVSRQGSRAKVDTKNIRARLASLTICDEEGNRLFSEADIEELGKKSASALSKIFNLSQKLSGVTAADVAELVEALDENPSDSSASDSP